MTTFFKCLRSGNVLGFKKPEDVAMMHTHTGYEVVLEQVPSEAPCLSESSTIGVEMAKKPMPKPSKEKMPMKKGKKGC